MTVLSRITGNPGSAGVIEPAREFITDVETAAQLWPFGNRSPQTQRGIPLGMDISGGVGCYDPYTSFMNGQQRAAQLGIIAANGLGKSVVCKKMATGFAAIGIPTIVPFDAKNEYLPLVSVLGGSTLRIDRSGGLNLLDPGECIQQATVRRASEEVIRELTARRNQLVATVAAISRKAPLKGWEFTALSAAIEQLPPGSTIKHLPSIFSARIEELAAVLCRTVERTEALLEPLALDVASMASGPIGQALGTTSPAQRWTPNVPLAVDTSAILMAEPTLSAAVIVSCWTAALSTIYLANATSATQIHAIIFDEIWRATREFPMLANQVGGLLRMDRNDGIISILATHSWTDTEQTGGSNILARCAAFALGGMQRAEVDTIADAGIGLNEAELAEIRNNASGGSSGHQANGGIGRFLFKVAEQPGRVIQTVLTPSEKQLLDTNKKWVN